MAYATHGAHTPIFLQTPSVHTSSPGMLAGWQEQACTGMKTHTNVNCQFARVDYQSLVAVGYCQLAKRELVAVVAATIKL